MRVIDLPGWREKCTACHACVSICPVKAIEMRYIEDGFLYPEINRTSCINCGRCTAVCHITQSHSATRTIRIVSGSAKDPEVVSQCSSGGVFLLLAQRTMAKGGIVIGAAFDSVNKEVRHSSTDDMALKDLLRSKYVQSRIGDTYLCVAKALREGRKVLFAGTPCQVRGLKAYLQACRVDGSLKTIDFVCHGVPSPLFFQEYLHRLERERHSEIVNITFREKDKGWGRQVIKMYYANHTVQIIDSLSNPLYFYFIKDYSLRDSCYECQEYRAHSADLTLADDWFSSGSKNAAGTSLVFVNTNTGLEMLREIETEFESRELDAKDGMMDIYSHDKYDKRKKQEWLLAWKMKGFEYLCGGLFRKLSRKEQMNRYMRLLKAVICARVLKGMKR